jgi:CBS domain-containing protein
MIHPKTTSERDGDGHAGLIATPVRSLVRRAPVTLPPDTPIIEAARLMRAHRISSVLLVEGGQLLGLVTDRDLRDRVVAEGFDVGRPVRDIATLSLRTIGIERPAFHALLLMARHNVHHVPVLDGRNLVGIVTSSDIAEQHADSAINLTGAIHEQHLVEGLVQVSTRIQKLQRNLAAANASAYSAGHIVSAMTDALTTRLLQISEVELGPPPVPYAWVAAGSQGRNEQTARSDQDNCMVLDDSYDETLHGSYFRDLSRRVCDGLDACGYVHCPGGMMAMTDQWRQPIGRWRQYFHRWIDLPEPEALMLTGVFLDQRFVYGRADLIDELRAEVVLRAQANKGFLAALAANALQRKPPLNWRGRLAPIKAGPHEGTIDLKMHGIVPIVDMARYHAFAAGSAAVNTRDRLEQAAGSGNITQDHARDLLDTLDFLSDLRLQHQAQRMADGQAADNYLKPATLSKFERGHLLEAFKLISRTQAALAEAYPVNLL